MDIFPGVVRFLLGLGWVLGLLVLPTVWFALVAWAKSYWGVLSRLHFTLVTLSAVAFIWSLHFWNLQSYF